MQARIDKILRLRTQFRSQEPIVRGEKVLYDQFRHIQVTTGGFVDTSAPPAAMRTM